MKRTARITLGLISLALSSAAFAQSINASAFFADPNPNWMNMQDDVGKVILQKTGVNLKAEYAIGDPDQKVNLLAASGQVPDLIAPKGAAGVLIDADAMLDLTDLINKYAPNIKKVIGKQLNRMKFSNKNQGIFFIPNNDTIGQIYFDNDAWFKLQLGALKEQKYPKVKTLKDYEKVIADYVKKHPKTSDGKPTIGLSLLADDWRFVISVTNPAFWATGGWDDGEWYIDPKTFKAVPHHFRPEEKEYFRWLNHMNDIGLLDKESFTQKYDQYLAKIASGRVVGLIDANWEIGDALNSLKAAGKFDQMYGRFPAVMKSGMKAAYNAPTGFRGGYGIGISKNAKDPVKLIKFLDFLSSDEGQVLINWGIEGKHYKVVNGKREFLPKYEELRKKDPAAFQRETGIGSYGMSLRYGDGVKDKTGNFYTTNFPDQILTNYTDAENAALKAYKVKFWGDLLPKASQFKPIPWAAAWSIPVPQDSALSEFWTKEQDITRKYIPKAILADPKDFDKIYDEMLDVMDKQLGKYSELQTQLVQDRLKLWGVLKK
ncbi:ABC transporter substrate-binding protein [Deinococcus roseus]|uniref:ABC transporter substrate-binding protein n=1 Tax=Deinococcus roseus TaxID=392414 RepID=A0ABQ2D4F9_9DEIO|nr:ABC transporter substrate-binding protein [Deinococcus roseus]GGJ38703.1 ABC transporter substrate-binding protein [Deinococcus roseus]